MPATHPKRGVVVVRGVGVVRYTDGGGGGGRIKPLL